MANANANKFEVNLARLREYGVVYQTIRASVVVQRDLQRQWRPANNAAARAAVRGIRERLTAMDTNYAELAANQIGVLMALAVIPVRMLYDVELIGHLRSELFYTGGVQIEQNADHRHVLQSSAKMHGLEWAHV